MARRQISMDEVLSALEELESRYGVPSDRRREAIAGEPCASEDLMLWDELVLVRDRVSARTGQVFFPYHLVGPDEVQTFMTGWLDSLGAITVPSGAPDFADLPGHLLRVGPFDLIWASDATLRMRMTVDVHPDSLAEPLLLAANLTRGGGSAWRYCRNDNHPEVGRDHLHLSGDTKLVGLPVALTMDQLTARLLAEPR